jgi:small subunit ribosomal protein S6
MSFYESTFIVRQDISSAELEKITEGFKKVVSDNKGNVVKKESWGLRTLAYRVKKNKKGHYVMLGIEGDAEAINELQRHYKLHEDVIRYITIKVEELSKEPSSLADRKAA